MGGICEYCVQGGYWECGEGPRCVNPADTLEDRCHNLKIIGRKRGDCLQARLYVGRDSNIPSGWKKWSVVPIRVATFYAGTKPTARVYAPPCEDQDKTCGEWRTIQVSAEDLKELTVVYRTVEEGSGGGDEA